MRLIDADALKEKFKERSYWTYTHEYGDAIPIGWIMSGIDNAPTVFDDKAYSDGYTQGTCDCEHAHERPQGEWIYERPNGKTYSDFVFCSVCHENNKFYKSNFCPNCGADMKGGAE